MTYQSWEISGKIQESKGWPKNWAPQKSPSFPQTPFWKKPEFCGPPISRCGGWNATLIVSSIRVLSESFPSTNLCSNKKKQWKSMENPWEMETTNGNPPVRSRGKKLGMQTNYINMWKNDATDREANSSVFFRRLITQEPWSGTPSPDTRTCLMKDLYFEYPY